MARSRNETLPLVPSASRQIGFHQSLSNARNLWLRDALSKTLEKIDPAVLKKQLLAYAPAKALRTLAVAGIRDEAVFPTPVVLESMPSLVGYYRLLLGSPQKRYYGKGTGLGFFKSMETRNCINEKQKDRLPIYCKAMAAELAQLVTQISPTLTARDIDELPLLTLGSQMQGSNNVDIGKQATRSVFLVVYGIVKKAVKEYTERKIELANAAGREVRIALASDPDISIVEVVGGEIRKKVAIEIKGGTDQSNAHNRAGEAEKSHLKAKSAGYRDFWTIIALKSIANNALKNDSPTTNSWFDVTQVLGKQGPHWDDFKSRFCEAVGIQVPD